MVSSTIKLAVMLLLTAGAGLALRPWIEQHLESRARTAYFEQGRAYAPRVTRGDSHRCRRSCARASGLAVSRTQPGVLWAHNDSGDAPMLYAIDLKGTAPGEGRGARTPWRIDWEDIAAGPCPGRRAARSTASTSPTPATTIDRGTS